MTGEKYYQEREIKSFPGIRCGLGERTVGKAKGLLCSRMFRDSGDHWAIDASFPKYVQILTPSEAG